MWWADPVFVDSSCASGSQHQQCGQSVRGKRDVGAGVRRTFKLASWGTLRFFSVFAFVFLCESGNQVREVDGEAFKNVCCICTAGSSVVLAVCGMNSSMDVPS